MENTVVEGQETSTVAEETTQERTFTQAELDDIVKSRVAKERAKFANYEELQTKASKFDELAEANKSELQKATEKAEALQKQLDDLNKETEVRNIREKVALQTGVPTSLLSADTEENCLSQAEAILAFANKPTANYPSVKDGGEVANIPSNKSNGQLFGDWLNNQINSN